MNTHTFFSGVRKTLLIISQTCLLWISFPSFAATLVVEITQQEPQGITHAALYTSDSIDWDVPPYRTAQTSNSSLVFQHLPPGTYALQLYQDVNSNNQLDNSRSGLPKEPVGFTNNPSIVNGKPTIEQCWIEVLEPQTSTQVRLFVRKRYRSRD